MTQETRAEQFVPEVIAKTERESRFLSVAESLPIVRAAMGRKKASARRKGNSYGKEKREDVEIH